MSAATEFGCRRSKRQVVHMLDMKWPVCKYIHIYFNVGFYSNRPKNVIPLCERCIVEAVRLTNVLNEKLVKVIAFFLNGGLYRNRWTQQKPYTLTLMSIAHYANYRWPYTL